MKNGKAAVSPEAFIKAWQKGESIQEIADALGMLYGAAACRACVYRKKGIPLKKFGTRGAPLDVASLSKLAKKSA